LENKKKMPKGKRYSILNALDDEYNISMTNNKFKQLITDYYIKNKNAKQLFALIACNGGYYPQTGNNESKVGKVSKKERKPKK
jgi:hypothetical protein